MTNVVKQERAASWIRDLVVHAGSLAASELTLDALTVYQSPLKAERLGRLWQHISNVEIREEEEGAIRPFGDEIDSIGWELENWSILVAPWPNTVDTDENEQEYNSEKLSEAMSLARQSILEAIYVAG